MGVPKTIDGIPVVQILSAEHPSNLGMTAVGSIYNGTLNNNSFVDIVRPITKNRTLKLQRLILSADNSGAYVELHYRVDSGVALSNATLLYKLFADANVQQIEMDESFSSGEIVMRIRRIGGNADTFARWKGYEI
jgi:hypothetical protein